MSKATVHPNDNGPEPSAGLSFSQVIAAGLASAGAAVLTSRFGVTGTLLGAALTTMIITGGSAVLKNYLERMSGHVQSIGTRTNRRAPKAARSDSSIPPVSHRTSEGMAVYGRRRNPFGGLKRRSVFVGALIPALLAFGIAITAVTGVELTGGRTLSCLVWNEGCQTASANGASEGSSTSLGRLTDGSSANSGDGIQRQTVDGNSQDSQQVPTPDVDRDSGIFGNDNPSAGSPDDVAPVIPGGSAGDSDSDGGVVTPGTGTNGGTPPTDGSDTGTAPVEEVPDYETPSTGTSNGMEEQTPTQTPSSSSRSSDGSVTPAPVTE